MNQNKEIAVTLILFGIGITILVIKDIDNLGTALIAYALCICLFLIRKFILFKPKE